MVLAVTADLLAANERPLYRCDAENEGSWRLCESIGYTRAVEYAIIRWPSAS